MAARYSSMRLTAYGCMYGAVGYIEVLQLEYKFTHCLSFAESARTSYMCYGRGIYTYLHVFLTYYPITFTHTFTHTHTYGQYKREQMSIISCSVPDPLDTDFIDEMT